MPLDNVSAPVRPGAFRTEPLYAQVQRWIVDRIRSGELRGAIPNEQELAREANVSAGTMRKALDALEVRGLVTRRQGRGTYVRECEPWVKMLEGAEAAMHALFPAATVRLSDDSQRRLIEVVEGDAVVWAYGAEDLWSIAQAAAEMAAWLERNALHGAARKR
jgi:DNA-binding FadR family transcriptional regulator